MKMKFKNDVFKLYFIFFVHLISLNPRHFSVGQLPITAFPKSKSEVDFILNMNENHIYESLSNLKKKRKIKIEFSNTGIYILGFFLIEV